MKEERKRGLKLPKRLLQNKNWQEGLSNRKNVQFNEYPKLNHFFTEGDGALSLPSEYEIPANVPEYVIQDIIKWVNETKK